MHDCAQRWSDMSESTGMYEQVMDDIVALEDRLDEFEQRLDSLEQLAERVDDLDARTDIMQLVDDSDDLSGKARSLRLLQHMQRKATRQSMDRIALTHGQAEEALHYPDLDRTTIYTDMRRCETLVEDDAIAWYETADEGNLDEACIVLDYDQFQAAADAGELPADVVDSTDMDGGA